MTDAAIEVNRGETDQGPPFVFGFGFKDGVASEMRWEDVASRSSDYDFIWLHLNMLNEEVREWIAAQRVADWQSAVDARVRHGRSQRRRR